MSAASRLIERIEQFKTHVSQIFRLQDRGKQLDENLLRSFSVTSVKFPDSTWQEPFKKQHERDLATRQAMRENEKETIAFTLAVGKYLSEEMVAAGGDATGVLKLVHFLNTGAFDQAEAIWPEIVATLQQFAIRLRVTSTKQLNSDVYGPEDAALPVWCKYPFKKYPEAIGSFNPAAIPDRIYVATHRPTAEEIAMVERLGLDAREPNFEKLRGKLLQMGVRADDMAGLSVDGILPLFAYSAGGSVRKEYVHPCTEIAWEVDRLLGDQDNRQRFLAQSLEYLQCRATEPKSEKDVHAGRSHPLPFDHLDGGCLLPDGSPPWTDPTYKPKPPLLLFEQYAILAALHAAVLPQRQPVDPWPKSPGESTNVGHMLWFGLVGKARELTGRDLPHLGACLASVKAGLGLDRDTAQTTVAPSKNTGLAAPSASPGSPNGAEASPPPYTVSQEPETWGQFKLWQASWLAVLSGRYTPPTPADEPCIPKSADFEWLSAYARTKYSSEPNNTMARVQRRQDEYILKRNVTVAVMEATRLADVVAFLRTSAGADGESRVALGQGQTRDTVAGADNSMPTPSVTAEELPTIYRGIELLRNTILYPEKALAELSPEVAKRLSPEVTGRLPRVREWAKKGEARASTFIIAQTAKFLKEVMWGRAEPPTGFPLDERVVISQALPANVRLGLAALWRRLQKPGWMYHADESVRYEEARFLGEIAKEIDLGITIDKANHPASIAVETSAGDLAPYDVEKQPWWNAFPEMTDTRTEQLTNLASQIDLVIITATDIELDAVLRLLKSLPRKKGVLKGFAEQETYYLGRFGTCRAVVTKCRMGSLDSGSAALATEHAQRIWRPRAVVMVGVAFGKESGKQRIGDVLVASQVILYEPQRVGTAGTIHRGPIPPSNPTLLNRFENAVGWTFRRPDGVLCRREVGPILSGEKLVDEPVFKMAMFNDYPQAIGGEMEGAGLSAAAVRQGTPWILVKAICDWADGNKDKKHQALAAAAAVSLVHHVLSQTNVLHGLGKPNQDG